MHFVRHVAQEVKVQRLTVEQVFDIDEHRIQFRFPQQFLAGIKRLVAKPFDSTENESIFRRHPSHQLTVCLITADGMLQAAENAANFEAPVGPADDLIVATVESAVD